MKYRRPDHVEVRRKYRDLEPGTLLYWIQERKQYETRDGVQYLRWWQVRLHWRTFFSPIDPGQREMILT